MFMTNVCGHTTLKQNLAKTHKYSENKETVYLWGLENIEKMGKQLFKKKIAVIRQ